MKKIILLVLFFFYGLHGMEEASAHDRYVSEIQALIDKNFEEFKGLKAENIIAPLIIFPSDIDNQEATAIFNDLPTVMNWKIQQNIAQDIDEITDQVTITLAPGITDYFMYKLELIQLNSGEFAIVLHLDKTKYPEAETESIY